MDAVIRCDPLDGQWQTLGTGRYRGVIAEGIEATANPWGPDTLTFNIKVVEPSALRPDLLPYTPIELEVGGMLVWSGRVKQRPSAQQDHSVSCEGWQYHLDDDLFSRVYVHTRLGDYRDQRTFLGAQLARFHVAGGVSNDQGGLVIGWPNGTVIPANGSVGVTLDLGPDSTGKRAVLGWESTNNTSTISAFVRCTDGEDAFGTSNDFLSFAMNTGASGTSNGTAGTARRYIHCFLYSAGGQTLAADVSLRITGLKIFRDTGFESGNASIIKADTLIIDALGFCPLLNQAKSLTAGTFSIPEALTQGYQSPREVMDWANAYENYRLKIGSSDLKSIVYDVKPTAPLFEIGEWSGSEFSDASVSGDEIYDKVIVEGTGPDGAPVVSTRTQTGTFVDRNGFHRTKLLPIRSAITSAVADRFGDLFLAEHKTSRFSGKLSVPQGGIRRHLGGATVSSHEMLLFALERLRFMHRVDPDTGGWGRDGTLAGVRYRHDDQSVELDIDDRRDSFEELIANRYDLLVGQLPG